MSHGKLFAICTQKQQSCIVVNKCKDILLNVTCIVGRRPSFSTSKQHVAWGIKTWTASLRAGGKGEIPNTTTFGGSESPTLLNPYTQSGHLLRFLKLTNYRIGSASIGPRSVKHHSFPPPPPTPEAAGLENANKLTASIRVAIKLWGGKTRQKPTR